MEEPLEAPEAFEFPFSPYDIQHEFMTALYEALEGRKLGIFESPTGTGKSLSIICGAIRWLKDHERRLRELLNRRIAELEAKKVEADLSSDDWIQSQAQVIQLTRQINDLKIEINKVNAYDEKINGLSKAKLKKTKTWAKKKTEAETDVPGKEEEKVEDEDMVLEESSEAQEESDTDEEDDEGKHKPTKIYICSRTHSQLAQFVGEIVKSPFSENVRVASLASRQSYCINPEVNRLKSFSLINERCLDLQKAAGKLQKCDSDGKVVKRKKGQQCKCPYFKQTAIEELKDAILTEVQDVEDLVGTAKQVKACPYYSSRLAAEDAEVVLVPYNAILHKATRDANGIDLKGNIVIVDEAHNLLEAMAQMHNSELNHKQVKEALRQVKCYKQRFNTRFSAANLLSINQLIFILNKLQQLLDKPTEKSKAFTVQNFVITAEIDNHNMFKMVKFCKESRLAQKVRSYAIKYPMDKEVVVEKRRSANKGIKDFLASIENQKNKKTGKTEVKREDEKKEEEEQKPPLVVTNPLLSVISFLECLTCSYDDGRVFLHTDEDKMKNRYQFLLLNPSKHFTDVVKDARSVIVAGGTMKPNSEFRERLFINSGADPERIMEFSCDHIIPAANILPIIVKSGPAHEDLLFTYERRMSMGNNLKSIVKRCCETIRGGVVLFFPSYSYENWVWQQIKDLPLDRPIFREPQATGSVETVLKKYAEAIAKPASRGALLLSVVGGKLSEGLNFSDDLGRCVIVVGLPYANIYAEDLKEKMTYWDKQEGPGAGRRFYENQCMKAVNQSIGRAVRHKDDFAAILLLDERYNRNHVKNALPNWIKRSLKVCDFQETFENVENFFKERK